MKFVLSAPSKTFLIGEYLATQGGTAIIAATTPRFQLEVSSGKTGISGISPICPAGKFLDRHSGDFADLEIKFQDPHSGAGGLGASSAQYALLLYFWIHVIKGKKDISRQAFNHLEEYIGDSWSGVGMKPSGADMVAQITGDVSVVNPSTHTVYSTKWPFEKLAFSLFRTGRKVATHLHLQNVSLVPKGILQEIADVTVKGLQEKSETIFLAGVKTYGETLAQFGFLDNESAKTIKAIYTWPETLAVKGCGAMGADIIMIVHRNEMTDTIICKAKELNLDFVAGNQNVSPGIVVQKIAEKTLEVRP